MKHRLRIIHFITFALIFIIYPSRHTVYAQQSDQMLNARVEKLEEYVDALQSSMVEYSDQLNSSIEEYTKSLETSLDEFARKMQAGLDQQLKRVNRHVVLLKQYSKSYQSLETNSGTFLISVEKTEPIENGIRLHLNIGNPNFADYQNFKLSFLWGEDWPGEHMVSYNDWHRSLFSADFDFQRRIEKGKWNPAVVDLIPAGEGPVSYIECGMSVSSIELGFN